MKEYETEYHKKLHGHLYSNKKYYNLKAKLALSKYFKGIPKDKKILEYGCGLGQNIYLLQNAIGYDISEFSLDFARKKGIKVTNDIKVIKDESCDIVFSAHVLEHLENPLETLKLMQKKLKKGGKLILVLPVEKHGKANFKLDDSQHLYCWNFRTINNLLINAGFQPIKNSYFGGAGYGKLLSISKINLNLYVLLTRFISFLYNAKEMKIIAIKK